MLSRSGKKFGTPCTSHIGVLQVFVNRLSCFFESHGLPINYMFHCLRVRAQQSSKPETTRLRTPATDFELAKLYGGRQTAFKRGGGGVSFSLWSIASLYKRPAAGGSVGWSVCHNFLEEREVTIS